MLGVGRFGGVGSSVQRRLLGVGVELGTGVGLGVAVVRRQLMLIVVVVSLRGGGGEGVERRGRRRWSGTESLDLGGRY